MKNILITGARAPVALELGKIFHQAGKNVFFADSCRLPFSRFSRVCSKFFYFEPPADQPHQFSEDLQKIIRENQVDLVIPTCEEVFYLAHFHEVLSPLTNLFCQPLAKLEPLHNKFTFIQHAQNCGTKVPQTELLCWDKIQQMHKSEFRNYVFKPVYSRFAAFTHIAPKKNPFTSPPKNLWIQQEKIPGREFCTYSIAVKGKLTAHACYYPSYRLGKSSSIYFMPIQHEKIHNFVDNFVRTHSFTGQIGFDIMESPQGDIYPLECNPRATSGLHLFAHQSELISAFLGDHSSTIFPSDIPKTIKVAMCFFAPLYFWQKGWTYFKDISKAQDVTFSLRDPWPCIYSFATVGEICWRSIRQFRGFREAATWDIEWNGNPIE